MGRIAVRNAAGATVLVAAALAATGCGGSSKSSSPAPVTVTPTTSAIVTTTAPTATHESTTTATGGTGSLKNCGSLTSFGQEFAKALAASSTSGTEGLKSQADTFKAFADKAPDAIRGDMKIIATAIGKYAEALKGVDLKAGQAPSAEVIAKLTAASKEFNQPAVSAAGQHISTWVRSHCHA